MRRFLLVLLVFAAPALALPLVAGARGPARVVDGDSLEVAGEVIRLHGMDAPEIGQLCARDGAPWACGRAARALLRQLVRGREVECRALGRDREGRRIAKCRVGWMDLGAEMIARGMAVPFPPGAPDYLANHREARALGEGIFAAEFVEPARWRRGERLPLEAAPTR